MQVNKILFIYIKMAVEITDKYKVTKSEFFIKYICF